MLIESYYKITNYLTETLGTHFIFFSILLTTIVSVVYFILMGYVVTQMDKRYFIRKRLVDMVNDNHKGIASPTKNAFKSGTTFLVNTLKIIAGIILLLCGILLLVLPGQGLITMIIGLSLLPFPGKKKIETKLLARKSVRNSLNWIRHKANKEPFIFD